MIRVPSLAQFRQLESRQASGSNEISPFYDVDGGGEDLAKLKRVEIA